ncbi:MAG: fibronectin type III domain-containing protein, partial [Bacteroidota bacterium]
VPVLENPPNNANNIPVNVTLEWQAIAGATYDVEVATDNKFSAIVGGATGISSNSFEVSALKPKEKHFWRVRAKTALGTGPWSNDRTFTTAAPSLPAPSPVYPPPGEKQVPMNLRLEWTAVAGADEYAVQISSDRQFRLILTETNGIKETGFELGKLLPGTTYYWRVRATGANGAGDWPRDGWDFTTATAQLAFPRLVSPSDGAKNVFTDPTLSWAASPGATVYAIQYATDRNFKKDPLEIKGILPTQYQLRGLSANESYYWRVRGEDSIGVSEWSDSWAFTTGSGRLTAPALITPSDQAKGVSTNPHLEWHPVSGAVSYGLQYTTNRQFKMDTITVTGIQQSSLALTGLVPNENYYWRVSVQDSTSSSEWSEARGFTTGSGKLAAPLLIAPSDGAKGVSINPRLEWAQAKGALSYDLQYALMKNFKKDVILVERVEKTSVTLQNLERNETYYWRVSARDSSGASDWSPEASFTTGSSKLNAPILISPSDEAKGVS